MLANIENQSKIVVSIPEQLKNGSFRFILLKPHSKNPLETKWQDGKNYAHDDKRLIEHLANGGNYGVLPVDGNACILDADEFKRLEQLGALDPFTETFTVRTGSEAERYHYYFTCENIGNKKIPFYDLVDSKKHLGELFATGCPAFCVGPNCIHPDTGNVYQIVNDSAISNVEVKELDDVFFSKVKSSRKRAKPSVQLSNKIPAASIKKYKQNTLSEQLKLRIEDFAYPAGEVTVRGDEIQGAHPVHGSTTGSNFSINTKHNIWHCYRCGSGGDVVLYLAVKHDVIRCEDAGTGQLNADQFNKVREILATEYGYGEELDRLKEEYKSGIKVSAVTNEEDFDKYGKNGDGLVYSPNFDDNHFVTRYADVISEMTDSYRDYQYASALMLLSMSVQRRAVMRMSYGPIYPNIWVMLLGSSSYSKKTTAIKFARRIAFEVLPRTSLGNDLTPERFAQDVSHHSAVWQFIDEISALLNGIKTKAYMSSYREMLCALYDNEPYVMGRSRRRRGGRSSDDDQETDWIIRDGYVNLYYATTPDMFTEATQKTDMTSGLFYRFLFFNPKYEKPLMPSDEETPDQRAALDMLTERLRNITAYFASNPHTELQFKMDKSAKAYYQEWEMRLSLAYHKTGNTYKQSAFARMNDCAKKLMMLHEIGSDKFYRKIWTQNYTMGMGEEWIIPLTTVKEICRQIEEYFIPTFEEIADKVCQGEERSVQERILKVLYDKGGKCSYRELRQRVRTNKKSDWEEAIRVLAAPEPEGTLEIEFVDYKPEGSKKPTRYVALIGESHE